MMGAATTTVVLFLACVATTGDALVPTAPLGGGPRFDGRTSGLSTGAARPRELLATPGAASARRRAVAAPAALQMNLFERFLRVGKANLNNILQRLEDPEKVLNQAVEDMQKDLVKIRQEYAEVMAGQKRTQRKREEAAEQRDSWMNRAKVAVEAGDDNLAREALGRKANYEDQVKLLDAQIQMSTENLNKLYEGMQMLEGRISESRSAKDQYVARARTAKATTKVNDMLSTVTGSTSMDAFERMKDKVEMLETQAEVAGQLTAGGSTPDLEAKFRALESGSKVDDELEQMKRLLAGGGGEKSEENAKPLPAATEATTLAVEDELNKLKKEQS